MPSFFLKLERAIFDIFTRDGREAVRVRKSVASKFLVFLESKKRKIKRRKMRNRKKRKREKKRVESLEGCPAGFTG